MTGRTPGEPVRALPPLGYDVAGPPDAPVLVLGPSLGTRRSLFDPQVAALSGRYRVIRFDLPGHGTSPPPTGPYPLGAVGDAVVAMLDRLGVRRFGYLGVSVSGAIGQALAIDHPDRLAALVVCASAAHWPDPGEWTGRAARVRAEGTAFLLPSRTGTWFSARYAAQHPAQTTALLDDLAGTDAESYALCCEAIGRFDARPSLARIGAPTLVVAGEHDPATPVALAEEIQHGIPGSRLDVVPGGLHLLSLEHADTLNAVTDRHMSTVDWSGEGTP